MFSRDNSFGFVGIVTLVSCYLLAAVFSRNVPESSEDFVLASARSLSLLNLHDLYVYPTCIRSVPTKLAIEHPSPPIQGTNQFWTNYHVCCEGYKEYEYNSSFCVPDCGKKCENGLCISPGKCICFPRHILNYDDECIHTCPLGCLNGKCSYDGKCTCDPGYTLDRSGQFCKPLCKEGCRGNRNCTSPNQCECPKGWKLNVNIGTCQFLCNPDCGEHGKCIDVNKCDCERGYRLKRGVCQAEDCKAVCENGICLLGNICQCNYGYTYDEQLTSCVPKCSHCENGTCIEPENCICYKGYAMINGRCVPVCPRGCINGICASPNNCYCKNGKVDKLGYCRKYGERGCSYQIKGTCIRWIDTSPYESF